MALKTAFDAPHGVRDNRILPAPALQIMSSRAKKSMESVDAYPNEELRGRGLDGRTMDKYRKKIIRAY